MKKSVIIAALGLTVGAMSSFGQGSLSFNSYLAGAGSTGVKIFNVDGITALGSGWTADLAWSLTPISESAGGSLPLNASLTVAASAAPSVGAVATPFDTGAKAGYFEGASNFALSPYTSGTTVYFEVLAYNGSSYANSGIRGHSASFSSTLTLSPSLPPNMPLFSSFSVVAVPEPATLALAGLGGLASLVALRRKQS